MPTSKNQSRLRLFIPLAHCRNSYQRSRLRKSFYIIFKQLFIVWIQLAICFIRHRKQFRKTKYETSKINNTLLKAEQKKYGIISPVLDFIKECRKPNFNERKKLCNLLNYWKDLKLNEKGLLVKATSSMEQVLLAKTFKEFVFDE